MRIRRTNHHFTKAIDAESYGKEKIFEPPKSSKQSQTKGFIENILSNPNLIIQVVVIIMTMSSESMQMERRIEGVATTVEKIRNVADVLNHTMTSVKSAAETPRKIRELLE